MSDEPEVLCSWSARAVQPVVLLCVTAVFVGFILIAHFVVHSKEAVIALALASVGAIVPLVPLVSRRIEYRLTPDEIQKRKPEKGESGEFSSIVRLDRLVRIVQVRNGFKFFRQLDEPNPFKRFWKLHLSDAHSGEIHVEKTDRDEVLAAMRDLGVTVR